MLSFCLFWSKKVWETTLVREAWNFALKAITMHQRKMQHEMGWRCWNVCLDNWLQTCITTNHMKEHDNKFNLNLFTLKESRESIIIQDLQGNHFGITPQNSLYLQRSNHDSQMTDDAKCKCVAVYKSNFRRKQHSPKSRDTRSEDKEKRQLYTKYKKRVSLLHLLLVLLRFLLPFISQSFHWYHRKMKTIAVLSESELRYPWQYDNLPLVYALEMLINYAWEESVFSCRLQFLDTVQFVLEVSQ